MNPYVNLSEKSFWKLAVANQSMFDLKSIWQPKFNILPKHKVATYGSCFAQHIGNALKARGFNWLIAETPPETMKENDAKYFNYNVFSARTANIYTTSLLRQWVKWCNDEVDVPSEIWEKDGRYFDPFRPTIEPNGFKSPEELIESRNQVIRSFCDSIKNCDYFVFTLGLTESWINSEFGYEYPMCPGTVAGEFNANKHIFVNQQFSDILKNLKEAIVLMRGINRNIKFILTVSPVPLTATMSGDHVLVATMHSKSILRAVAGQLASTIGFVDYFPSYEIINSPVFKGAFFEPNQRSVNPYGVAFVMDNFFNSLYEKFGVTSAQSKTNNNVRDAICEEELLEAFKKS
jgi:hypothetical protein